MLQAAPGVLQRLTEALDRFDSGNQLEIHNIAALNRTILGSGKGDRLVLRLSNAFKLDLPEVGIPAVTELRGPIALQIGPIPCTPEDAVRMVALQTWLDEAAVKFPHGSDMRWERFIRDFANESSTHVSVHVSVELEEIKLHHGPSSSMSEYLVRAAGAVAEHALSYVLNQKLGSPVLQRRHHAGPIRVRSIVSAASGEFGFDFLFESDSGGHIATIPWADQIHEVDLIWNEETETGTVTMNSRPAQ